MSDMLVRLYDLPPLEDSVARCAAMGITVRRAMPYEKSIVLAWIRLHFSAGWSDEAEAGFGRHPINCIIATEAGRVVGFSAHDVTARGYFGPTGVQESHRGRGIGKALLLSSLHALHEMGHAYAIIGSAAEKARDFYANTVGATIISGSSPGIYRDRLK